MNTEFDEKPNFLQDCASLVCFFIVLGIFFSWLCSQIVLSCCNRDLDAGLGILCIAFSLSGVLTPLLYFLWIRPKSKNEELITGD
jgi:hypothetical protein